VFDAQMREFLEGGCALHLGFVAADGEPYASRAWSAHVLDQPGSADGATGRLRLAVPADDLEPLQGALEDGPIAITAVDIPTLFSRQLKGRTNGVSPLTPDDEARVDAYCEAFFGDIELTEHMARDLIGRRRPAALVAVEVVIDEIFDQTPGVGAGARVGATER
jgi:hypothetical protein